MHAMEAERTSRPSWPLRILLMLGRTLLLTILFTALGMALGLMVGIVTTILGAAMHNAHPDMRNAYRHFAFPTAITIGSCALVWNVISGIRRLTRG
jgi:hypothetical protein